MTPEEAKIIEQYLKTLQGGGGPGELEMLASQPEALRKALSKQSTFEDEQKLLQQQLRSAERESNTPMARGRSVRDGIYVRADPSEMLSSAFSQIGGGLKENKLNSQLASGLREYGGTTDMFNAWKQAEAAKFLDAERAKKAVAGEHMGAEADFVPALDPSLTPPALPKKPLATSKKAPVEVGGLSELTDTSPQRGRGYLSSLLRGTGG